MQGAFIWLFFQALFIVASIFMFPSPSLTFVFLPTIIFLVYWGLRWLLAIVLWLLAAALFSFANYLSRKPR